MPDLISDHEVARRAGVRPGERYAWYGPALLITDPQGSCGDGTSGSLTGFYFRETRYLSRLRLTINGELPWLCSMGGDRPSELAFNYAHPELTGGSGGGTGAAGEELPRDGHGLPRRAMDLLARYRIGFHTLDLELILTNRWAERAELEIAWDVQADFADLLEVQAGDRQQAASVTPLPGEGRLRLRYTHPALPLETLVEATGASWRAECDRLVTRATLARGEIQRLMVSVTARDDRDMPDPASLSGRDAAAAEWHGCVSRVRTMGEIPFGHGDRHWEHEGPEVGTPVTRLTVTLRTTHYGARCPAPGVAPSARDAG